MEKREGRNIRLFKIICLPLSKLTTNSPFLLLSPPFKSSPPIPDFQFYPFATTQSLPISSNSSTPFLLHFHFNYSSLPSQHPSTSHSIRFPSSSSATGRTAPFPCSRLNKYRKIYIISPRDICKIAVTSRAKPGKILIIKIE